MFFMSFVYTPTELGRIKNFLILIQGLEEMLSTIKTSTFLEIRIPDTTFAVAIAGRLKFHNFRKKHWF